MSPYTHEGVAVLLLGGWVVGGRVVGGGVVGGGVVRGGVVGGGVVGGEVVGGGMVTVAVEKRLHSYMSSEVLQQLKLCTTVLILKQIKM